MSKSNWFILWCIFWFGAVIIRNFGTGEERIGIWLLIFIGILSVIAILFIFYNLIKFVYKFTFNTEFRITSKSNLRGFFSFFEPETIKNYILGNLIKSERNAFIASWAIATGVFIIVVWFISIISIWGRARPGMGLPLFDSLFPFVFYPVAGMLLVGFITSWLKNKNIKLKFPNKEHKNNFEKNVEDRLSKLKDLLDRGVIDRQEYEKQREKIIGDV